MKNFFRLSNQAITLLKQPELKLQLMLFFEVNDPRTIECRDDVFCKKTLV